MHRTVYFNIIEHGDYVEVIRTSVPLKLANLYEDCLPALKILQTLRHQGVLFDVRKGEATNPSVETAMKRIRQEMTEGHPRVSALTESAGGRLRASHRLRENEVGSHIRVFSDEAAARAFARGMLKITM